MRATADALSSEAAAVFNTVITHQGQQTTSVGYWTDASHREVQASRWLSDLMKLRRHAVALLMILTESLILAQDERWRRA